MLNFSFKKKKITILQFPLIIFCMHNVYIFLTWVQEFKVERRRCMVRTKKPILVIKSNPMNQIVDQKVYIYEEKKSRYIGLGSSYIWYNLYIYILIGKTQRKSNQILQLKSNFASCVLNYLFLESFIFLILEPNVGSHHKYSSK